MVPSRDPSPLVVNRDKILSVGEMEGTERTLLSLYLCLEENKKQQTKHSKEKERERERERERRAERCARDVFQVGVMP